MPLLNELLGCNRKLLAHIQIFIICNCVDKIQSLLVAQTALQTIQGLFQLQLDQRLIILSLNSIQICHKAIHGILNALVDVKNFQIFIGLESEPN